MTRHDDDDDDNNNDNSKGRRRDEEPTTTIVVKPPPRSCGSARTVTTAEVETSDATTSGDSGSENDTDRNDDDDDDDVGFWGEGTTTAATSLLPIRDDDDDDDDGAARNDNNNDNVHRHQHHRCYDSTAGGDAPSPSFADVEEGRRRGRRASSRNPLSRLVPDRRNRSVLMLNLVAVIWGSQHAVMKTVVTDSDPAAFTFLRFGLAALVAAPFLPGVEGAIRRWCARRRRRRRRRWIRRTTTTGSSSLDAASEPSDHHLTEEEEEEDGVSRRRSRKRLWKPWRWGLEMGFWMFLGFALQAVGLRTTTAQRSGFLLYLNVKFVPFFAYLLFGRRITCGTWVSALAAFTGTALLAFGGGDGVGGGGGGSVNAGDLWSIAAAAASAMFILRLEVASAEVPRSSELNATSLAVVAAFSGVWWLWSSDRDGGGDQASSSSSSSLREIAWAHPVGVVYLAVVSTALANLLQTRAQRDVPAERASVVYSLDPVYGAVFSWAILGETLGSGAAYAGAAMIFAAAAVNSYLAAVAASSNKNNKKKKNGRRRGDDDDFDGDDVYYADGGGEGSELTTTTNTAERSSTATTTLFSPEAVTASNT